jgi:hypothetical protein
MRVDDPRIDFLNKLERTESKLLGWGLVDGSFSADEMSKLCEDYLDKNVLWDAYHDADAFKDAIEDSGLLFEVTDGLNSRYRTRMGETIRLLVRLRQLFPMHLQNGNRRWQIAKPLVGDFRFSIRPRSVPIRELGAADVRSRIESSVPLTQLQRNALDSILSIADGQSMKLAMFQGRATENILRQLRGGKRSGTIVCAGTGSGKTLSFYLPAFLSIVESIDSAFWTKCLAIYPRNELLKDQLAEAYVQARKLDSQLKAKGKRKLIIATLFGSTPGSERNFEYDPPPRGWVQAADGHICPYLSCPNENCQSELIWRSVDREAKRHRLCCRRCNRRIEDDELILTRERLRTNPADILFTTTEMLNQRMGDSELSHVFGIGMPKQKKPTMVLLDEVHTYSGVPGAQTALLLRRWKHLASVSPHFVGLSATLADARRFFATLIGEKDSQVEEVSPHAVEVQKVGMEYLVALRGDPASQSSLLSTSIQTAMLMRRTLDARNNNTAIDSQVYGSKVFVFTDDLDVTNRMFYNLRDAEGQDSWGNADVARHPMGSLANLRGSRQPEQRIRNRFGQYWGMSESLGHQLLPGTSNLRIERTSSQDTGVATNSDIIVATASLEVGFNDPEVNAVLQHKAPRDPAQFLQRKGRAGRRIEMRPWTIVTLSDYGRDRLAWECFDLLFDPELPPRDLPVGNRYVLRMQVVFAFFDWISTQLRNQAGLPSGSVYRDFSGPAAKIFETSPSRQPGMQARQQAEATIIEGLLLRDEQYHELVSFLMRSLQQSEDVVEALLWHPPRALMTSVLPTLLRRLQTNWRIAGKVPPSYDNFVSNNPLPEFVPANLFGDLNLPEVTLRSPPQQRNVTERIDVLPILQAMREFAPGRVSRRFGVMNSHARHWLQPGDIALPGVENLELQNILIGYEELGQFEHLDANGNPVSIRCVRPREMQLVVPPLRVMDSSNASLTWNTQLNPQVRGICVELPQPSRWEGLIREIEFFTHNTDNPLEIRRFATESKATINFNNGQSTEKTVTFVNDRANPTDPVPADPVGIGFAIDVDGIVIRFQVPNSLTESISSNPAMLRSLRVSRFRDGLIDAPTLEGVANVFQRRWLAQVYISALTTTAIDRGYGLQDCWSESESNRTILDFQGVLGVIFQSLAISTRLDDTNPENEELGDVQQQLQMDLSQLFGSPVVLHALHSLAPTLWEEPNASWRTWLIRKFKTTLGAAVLDGMQQICRDLDAGDLLLDIDAGPRPQMSLPKPMGVEELWITESTIGGGGIVEAFLTRYGEDPRRFFDLVENALRPSDYEIVDQQLTMLLDLMVDPSESVIRTSISQYREATSLSHNAHSGAFSILHKLLTKRGLFTCHGVISAIANRILRPGSTLETDALLHRMVNRWKELEERLSIEIDPRVLAFLESENDDLDVLIRDPSDNAIEVNRRQWRFNMLFSLLWPRGGVSRNARLSVYNPFSPLRETEHDLVRLFLSGEPQRVSVHESNWLELASEHLVRDSEVILFAEPTQLPKLRKALLDIMTAPIDSGFLLLHPKVNRVDRFTETVEIRLSLPEGIQ